MIYNSRTTKRPDYYNDQAGNIAGDIAIAGANMIPVVGSVVSASLAAGKFASKMIPTDEYGIAKSEFGASMQGMLDPFSNIDTASNDWEDGNYGRAVYDILNPMAGGVRRREQQLEDLTEAKKGSVTKQVGAFDNMAGTLSGHSTGVDTIIDKPFVQEAGYTGPTTADAIELGTSIVSAGKQIKTNKANALIDESKDVIDTAEKTVNKSIVEGGVDKATGDVSDLGDPDFSQLDLEIDNELVMGSKNYQDIYNPIIGNDPIGLINNPPQMKSIYSPDQSFSINDSVYTPPSSKSKELDINSLLTSANPYERKRFSIYR